MSASRHANAWVVSAAFSTSALPLGDEADTTRLFIQTLAQAFSPTIQAKVVQALDLKPHPKNLLSAQKVLQALAMARTCRQVAEGIDFLTQLECRAQSLGGIFQKVCGQLGVDVGKITPMQAVQIDTAMQQRFTHAYVQGQTPVSSLTAVGWLKEILDANAGLGSPGNSADL